MAYAKIAHQWADESMTVLEVGSEEAAHPDLLDELTTRVVRLWRETCAAGAEDEA